MAALTLTRELTIAALRAAGTGDSLLGALDVLVDSDTSAAEVSATVEVADEVNVDEVEVTAEVNETEVSDSDEAYTEELELV